MKKIILILFLFSCFSISYAQKIDDFKNIKPKTEFENIHVQPMFSDENSSVFLIWVKQEVRLHKHENHTENVLVLEGKGEIILGDEKRIIKKGDWICIPKNTPHAVTKVLSKKPLKAVSIQSPKFEGKDRIFLDSKEKSDY